MWHVQCRACDTKAQKSSGKPKHFPSMHEWLYSGGRGGGRRVMAERCAGVSKRPFNCDNSALVYFLKNRHMCTSRLGFHLKVLVYEICDILFTNNANENATTTWPTKTRPHNILCIYKHSRKK